MSPLVKYVKQVLNRIEAGFQKLKIRSAEKDDTVEAQAQTFRIWMWSSAAGLALIVITSVVSMSATTSANPASSDGAVERSVLASLPDGYVIAPIDPTNSESLDSIFDEHGYADLYQATAADTRGKCIARGLPLIRAPKNPRRFAVLVSETQAGVLASLNEPVLVVLRKKPAGKPEAAQEPLTAKRSKNGPIQRELKGNIDLIQEEIPENAQPSDSGVRS